MNKPAAKGRASPSAPRKNGGSRSLSREYVLRALYAQQLNDTDIALIAADVREDAEFGKANSAYFETLLHGVLEHSADLEIKLTPHLDRAPSELSPIERGILLIGAHEIVNCTDVPYRVAINEAVELAKKYGGTDGHKYVNGVLDKLARQMRPEEFASRT